MELPSVSSEVGDPPTHPLFHDARRGACRSWGEDDTKDGAVENT